MQGTDPEETHAWRCHVSMLPTAYRSVKTRDTSG